MTVQLIAIAVSLALAAPGWALVAGGGSKRSDCFLETDFGSLSTPTKGQTTRITCNDCDQNCDAGPAEADGACVVSFDICPKQTDSALPNCDATRTLGRARLKGLEGTVDTASSACQPVTATVRMRRRRGEFRKTSKNFRAQVKASGRPRLTDTDNYRITCNPSPGTCVTTTTTTTSSSTTSTTEPPLVFAPCPDATGALEVSSLDFTTVTGHGECGMVTDDASGAGTKLKSLTCGGLNIGGDQSTVLEGLTPDGATTRFCVQSCDANVCTLAPSTDFGPTHDCSTTRCNFGPPLPIPNFGTSTCVINTFKAPGSGSINYNTAATTDMVVPLDSHVYLTGNPTNPCPICLQTAGGPACAGTPDAPCTGVCSRGPDAGGPCTSTNSAGLSKDCDPDGTDLGSLEVNLNPLTTGQATKSHPGVNNGGTQTGGIFCPGQDPTDPTDTDSFDYPGCFGTRNSNRTGVGGDVLVAGDCRYIEENGAPAGSLLPIGTAKPSTLATVFCIPVVPGQLGTLINSAGALPGPGATTLVGMVKLNAAATTTTTTTTTTTEAPTTTTTTSTTTTTT